MSEEDESVADLRLVAASGTGEAEAIMAADRLLWQLDFGPTRDEIVFRSDTDIFRASVGRDTAPVPLTRTPVQEENPELSPDGRWLAYTSNETGRWEVYVRSYHDMGPVTLVSADGGQYPAWSGDGDRLFYRGQSRLMEARLRFEEDTPVVTERISLFPSNWIRSTYHRSWDVSLDGEWFVAIAGRDPPPVWRVNTLAQVASP